jgi:hypothetical protein
MPHDVTPAPIERPDTVAYVGDVARGFGHECAYVHENGDVYPLPHIVRHSPTGFAWGYGGSGPAELARCLLIHFYGDAAKCGRCDGRGTEAEHYCLACGGDGYTLPVSYQDFKFDIIARIPQDEGWRLSGADILRWTRERRRPDGL